MSSPALKRALGFGSAWMITMGAMVGSGIFRTPHDLAAAVPSPSGMALAWVVGGVLSLLGALCMAELSSAMPESGGMVVYLRRAFGPAVAFLFAWSMLVELVPVSLGFFARMAAGALFTLAGRAPRGDLPPWDERLVAAAVVTAVVTVNVTGVRAGARLQNVLTAVKVAGVLALAAAGLLFARVRPAVPAGAVTWSGMATGLLSVLWTYDGWVEPTSLGGEMREPRRDLPRGITAGVLCVTALYLIVHAAFVRGLGVAGLASAPTPAVDLVGASGVGARASGALVSLLVLTSTLGACAVGLLTGSRVVYAAAVLGLLPAPVARLNARGAPSVAVLVIGAMAAVFTLVPSIGLGEVFVLGAWPFYALCTAGLVVLRRREPSMPRPVRAWGYPATPALFAGTSVAIVVAAAVDKPRNAAVSLAVILAGLPAYGWVKRRSASTQNA